MPIYEYTCADCGKRSEVFRRTISAADTGVACAHCGGTNTNRAISTFAFAKAGDIYGSKSEENYLDSLGDGGGFDDGFGGDDFGGLDDDF